MKRMKITAPTPEQEGLLVTIENLDRIESVLGAPLDINFLPDDQIDARRLGKVRRRLLDETRVLRAAWQTQLMGTGDNIELVE